MLFKKKSVSNIPEQVALSKSILYCLRIQHRNDSMRTYLTILIECYFIPVVFVLKNTGHTSTGSSYSHEGGEPLCGAASSLRPYLSFLSHP